MGGKGLRGMGVGGSVGIGGGVKVAGEFEKGMRRVGGVGNGWNEEMGGVNETGGDLGG